MSFNKGFDGGFNSTFINIGNDNTSEKQWVARLDGATQYWQFDTPIIIPENADFKIKFAFIGFNNSFEGLLDSTDDSFWLRFMPESQNNNIQGRFDDNYISGIPHSLINLRDSNLHDLTLSRESGQIYLEFDQGDRVKTQLSSQVGFNIDRLGKFLTSVFEGILYNFEVEVNGIVQNRIPLTNKEQGATQLATVGNVNAFMTNYTGDVWERL